MKRILLSLAVPMIIAGCKTSNQTGAGAVGLVKLENYFINNNVALADANYYVVTNAADFNNLFGVAKTMDNTIITPDFNGKWVVAAALKETNRSSAITFEKAEIAGRSMHVYLHTSGSGDVLSYSTKPLALATVPKSGNVKSIHFFVNGADVKTLPVN